MEISESSSTSRKRRRGHEEGIPESKDSDQSISLDVLAKLPFLVTSSTDANDSIKEEILLRYRCLDLRRPQMSSKIMMRHQVVKLIIRYLGDVHGFVEIETPILSRSTPEGARDYLVPLRVQGFTNILEIIMRRTFKADGPLGSCFGPFCLCT